MSTTTEYLLTNVLMWIHMNFCHKQEQLQLQ